MSGSESNSLPSTPSSGYDSPLPLPSVANAALPVPGQNARSGRPLKKSHARKQPPGHVPRPCNAFILFRCDFVRQKKIPASVERDHRNISRIAGKVWREMSETEKAPWTSMAEKEREKHSQAHPGYRYAPVGPSASSHSKRKKGKDTVEGRQRPYTPDTVTTPYRRSSSCPPPGAVPVPPNMETLTPNMMYIPRIRDDLARRPSRTIMYQIAKEDAASMSPPIDSQSYNKLSYLDDVTYPANMVYEPTYVFGRIEPPKGHPGWDASPPKPYLWTGPLQGYRGTEQHQHYYASGNFNNFNTSSPQTYFAPLSPPIFTDPFATSQSTAPSKMGSALDSLDNPRCLPAYSTMPPLADDALGFLLANPDRYPPSPYHSAQLGAAANYDPRCDIGLLLPRLSITNGSATEAQESSQ
ncbi:hypothetical protein PC9H_003383 [Pleurotus ostreatus]|uniref:HMG box domain-containing protein n=3 Tax=Pleurotus TaxID=5320 RepID=A0A8H7DVB3_PLEOS|nr:uncharacterized protein PC9H_003383 [Pleurotus ostreatus]KAF7436550.1 hypothetical protein PC9H_003383 [Pleurotus ostreatus]KAG9222555.1 hypothetical protein CCMSSC00406_0002890 [Pleurotus cornucopiae]